MVQDLTKIDQIRKNLSNNGPIVGLLSGLRYLSPPPLNGVIHVVIKELTNGLKVDLPLKHRIKAYKLGLPSDKYCEYGIKKSSTPNLYLSEFSAQISYSKLGKNEALLSDKEKFYEYMCKKNLRKFTPTVYGIIKNGIYMGEKNLLGLLNEKRRIVLKPSKGSGGKGIIFCEIKNHYILINGKKGKMENLNSNIEKSCRYLVMEYCKQADFLQKIYPRSANTVRILTLYPEYEDPFIAHAYLRIGTNKSGRVDNISQGGLTAEIDLETGRLSSAVEFLSPGEIKLHEKHPDTGSQIKNVSIPKWNLIKNKFLNINQKLRDFDMVVWDVLLTKKEDFIILEGNNKCPHFRGSQVHSPLLEKRKTREFFRTNGIPI